MYITMVPTKSLVLIAAIISRSMILALDSIFPSARYQHEIIYPSSGPSAEFSATTPEIGSFSVRSELPLNVAFGAAGNAFRTPVLHSVNLFTPNTVQQPAATPGQIENYRKALEEEARELEREQNSVAKTFEGGIENLRNRPKSYVSVNVEGGAKKYNYGYMLY